MTTITASRPRAGVTAFERTLLATASALDSYVGSRVQRRDAIEHRRALAAQASAALARHEAQARGCIGLLPR